MPPKKTNLIEVIAKHAATRGVSIFIDSDNITETANSGSPYSFDPHDKLLTIVTDLLNPQEKESLLPIIRNYLEKHGLLLDYQQEEIVETYGGYVEENPDKDIISFFTGKIPNSDLNALKMSLFMRSEKAKGYNIDVYKHQIRDRFGARGSYIANLCNAGYFENVFMPAGMRLGVDKFSDYYELRVGKELSAIFVHSGLTMASMKKEFQEKIDGCLYNGISKFRIHGFGRQNVDFIKEFFALTEDVDWGADFTKEIRLEIPQPPAIEYDIVLD